MAPSETAQYGMVTACYFVAFMYRYRKGLIVTDKRAMVNVLWVFMLSQPLCRVIGGQNGLMLFAAICMSSIILFPSPAEYRQKAEKLKKEEERREAQKSKTKKKKT